MQPPTPVILFKGRKSPKCDDPTTSFISSQEEDRIDIMRFGFGPKIAEINLIQGFNKVVRSRKMWGISGNATACKYAKLPCG
jgi:hypothetical protein